MPTIVVPTWAPVFIRGQSVSINFTFRDEDGALFDFDSAEIVVTPVGSAEFTWDSGSGALVNTSTGVYRLTVSAIDTAAYTWSNGVYRWSCVLLGEELPCLFEGRIFVKDC
jgi:hypothetical protein